MGDDFLFTVCCPSCGTVLGKAFHGTRAFNRCPKCSAYLYYEITDNGATVKIIDKPKTLPKVLLVPA